MASTRFEDVNFSSDSSSESDSDSDSSSEEEIQPIRKSVIKQRAEAAKKDPAPPQVNGKASERAMCNGEQVSSKISGVHNAAPAKSTGKNIASDSASVDTKSDSSAIDAGDESEDEYINKTKQKQKQLSKGKGDVKSGSFDSESDYEIQRHRSFKRATNDKGIADSGTSGHGDPDEEALPSSDGPDLVIDPSGRIVPKEELKQGNADGISISDVHCEELVNSNSAALLPRDEGAPKVLEMQCTTENFGENTSKIEKYASKLTESAPEEDGSVKRDYEETALKAMIEKGDEGDEISATSQMRYQERERLTKTDAGVAVAEVMTNSSEVHETTTRTLEQVGDQRYVTAKTKRRASASSSKKVFDQDTFTQNETGGILKLALDAGGSREEMAAAALDQLTSSGSVNEGSKISIRVAGTGVADANSDKQLDSKAAISAAVDTASCSSETSTSELSSSFATSEDKETSISSKTSLDAKQAATMAGYEEYTGATAVSGNVYEPVSNGGIPVAVIQADIQQGVPADGSASIYSKHAAEAEYTKDIVNNFDSKMSGNTEVDASEISVPVFVDCGSKNSGVLDLAPDNSQLGPSPRDQHDLTASPTYNGNAATVDLVAERRSESSRLASTYSKTTEEADLYSAKRSHNLTSQDFTGKMEHDIRANGEFCMGDENAAGALDGENLSRRGQISAGFSRKYSEEGETSSLDGIEKFGDFSESKYDKAKRRAAQGKESSEMYSSFTRKRTDADNIVARILAESSGKNGSGPRSPTGNKYRINMDGPGGEQRNYPNDVGDLNGEPSLLERRIASMGDGRPEGVDMEGGYRSKYAYGDEEEENDTGYRSKYISGPMYDPENDVNAAGYRPRYGKYEDTEDTDSLGRYGGRPGAPNYDDIAETQSLGGYPSSGSGGGGARAGAYRDSAMRRQKAVYGEEEVQDDEYGYSRAVVPRRHYSQPESYGAYNPYENDYDDDDDNASYSQQPEELFIPDADFEPQEREETKEIVEERTRGIKGMVERQNEVVDKLRKASVSFDDMEKEIRELKQQCFENQARRDCLLDELWADPAMQDGQMAAPEPEPLGSYRSKYGGSQQLAIQGTGQYGAGARQLGTAASFDYGYMATTSRRREPTIDRELESDNITSMKALGSMATRSYGGGSMRKSQSEASEEYEPYEPESPYSQRKYRSKYSSDDYADSGLGTDSTVGGAADLADEDGSDTSSVRSYSRSRGLRVTGEYGSATARSSASSSSLRRYGRSSSCVSLDSYRTGGSMSNLSSSVSKDNDGFSSRFLSKVREKRLVGDSTTSEKRGDKPFTSRFLKKSFDAPSTSSYKSKGLSRSYSFGGERTSSYTSKYAKAATSRASTSKSEETSSSAAAESKENGVADTAAE